MQSIGYCLGLVVVATIPMIVLVEVNVEVVVVVVVEVVVIVTVPRVTEVELVVEKPIADVECVIFARLTGYMRAEEV